MTVDISIGQRIWEEWLDGYWTIKTVNSATAPVFENDEFTGTSNRRSLNFAVFPNFTHQVGLGTFMGGLMGKMTRLNDYHGMKISKALRDYQKANPNATNPGFEDSDYNRCADYVVKHTEAEYHLARLIWLEYWVITALETLDEPYIWVI